MIFLALLSLLVKRKYFIVILTCMQGLGVQSNKIIFLSASMQRPNSCLKTCLLMCQLVTTTYFEASTTKWLYFANNQVFIKSLAN